MVRSYSDNTVTILYLNIYGQTKFYDDKQLQLQEMIQKYNCDIVHLQEANISDETFRNCSFIRNNFQVISNNSASSLIKELGLVGLGLEIRFCRFPIGAGSVWLRYLEQLIIFECPPSSGSS